MKFDLHCHTTKSDGLYTPKEVLNVIGVNDVFSITDHDNMEAHTELSDGRLVGGIEISARFGNLPIEILLYNYDKEKLKEEPIVSIKSKYERQLRIYKDLVKKAKSEGLVFDEVSLDCGKFAHTALYDELVKHDCNFRIIPEELSSTSKFFRMTTCVGHSLYTAECVRGLPTMLDINKLSRRIGGFTFLAHPFYYNTNSVVVKSLVRHACGVLDGVECLHPSATEEQSRILLDFCSAARVKASGGSDWHGRTEYSGTPNLHLAELQQYKQLFEWIQ